VHNMYAKRDLCMQKETYTCKKGPIYVRVFGGIVHTGSFTKETYNFSYLVDLHSALCTHNKRGMHTNVKRDLRVAVCTHIKRHIPKVLRTYVNHDLYICGKRHVKRDHMWHRALIQRGIYYESFFVIICGTAHIYKEAHTTSPSL